MSAKANGPQYEAEAMKAWLRATPSRQEKTRHCFAFADKHREAIEWLIRRVETSKRAGQTLGSTNMTVLLRTEYRGDLEPEGGFQGQLLTRPVSRPADHA